MRLEMKSIVQKRVVLVEGRDAVLFLLYATRAWGLDAIQMVDFGGNENLALFLKETLPNLPGFDQVESLVIVRDAEANVSGAVQSLQSGLQAAGLAVPAEPFQFTEGKPRVAFMLFPGPATDPEVGSQLTPGSLEDLCIHTLADATTLPCVESYLACLQQRGEQITHPHKTRLHAYLAGRNDFVGMKIGEASQAGAWDWSHPALEPFKTILQAM